jgi:hypothetical protein
LESFFARLGFKNIVVDGYLSYASLR